MNWEQNTLLAEDLPMAVATPDTAEVIVMAYNGWYRMRADESELRRISLVR